MALPLLIVEEEKKHARTTLCDAFFLGLNRLLCFIYFFSYGKAKLDEVKDAAAFIISVKCMDVL